MNKLKTKKSLSFPTWPYLATPIIVTLYFNVAAADPFNTPKFMLLLIFTTYMLSYVLLQARNLTFNLKDSQVRIYLLISIFLLFLLIATFNTDQRFVGLFGESQRRNGFLTYLMLSILLIYATLVANIISAKKLINVVILVALIQGLYGLLQSMGRDFVNWNNPYNPVITTMGNPNYASAVLAVFAVLSSLLLFVKPLSIIMKLILVVTTFVSMYVVISSDSRQGLILFAISILFYTTIYISRQYKKYRPWAILTFFTFISFGILAMLQIGPLTQFIYKQSVSVRGYYWRAGISMFLDKPFFGVGVDRYGSYFKEYRELEYPLKYGFDITSTDAHNNFIQMFATGGVFVGLLYMFITLYVFYAGMKLIFDKKNENFQLCLIIFSARLGLLAQSVVSINNLGTAVWSWTIGLS